MKKIVLILALFFAIGMQANTIKEKHNLKLDVKKVEMPEIGGQTVVNCTTSSHTYTSVIGGHIVIVTITTTICDIEGVQ